MGGVKVSEEELEESSNPWWKQTVSGAVIGVSVVTGGLVITYVVMEILSKLKKKPEAQGQ